VAPLEELGAAINARYGNRVQRIGYYALEDTHGWTDEEWVGLITTTRQ
jgi:hypothetical protein